MGSLFVGASRVDITPPSPVMMGGAFMSYRSSRIWDPLYASSAAISDGEKTVILVSCDLGDIDEDSVASIRRQISQATGIEPSHIMVSVIHTHNAPYLRGDRSLFKSREDIEESNRLLAFAQEKIPQAAIEAYRNMQPAKMGYGSGTAERCGFNRRYIMSSGRSQMHPTGVDNPDRLKVEGPVDNQVQVVWFEDEQGSMITCLVNFSAHAAMLYGHDCVSADYPGVMRRVVCGAVREEFPILFIQGACGNVSTLDYEHDDAWGKKEDGYRHIGRILGGEVVKLMFLSRAEKKAVHLSLLSKIVDIPYRDYGREAIGEACALLKAAEMSGNASQYLNDQLKDTVKKSDFHSLMLVERYKRQAPRYPCEIAAIRIADVMMVTNPMELFVEYQLELKKRFTGRKLIMSELTNGFIGYVPTRLAIALGGYGAINRRLDDAAGQMVVEASSALIERLLKEADGNGSQ